ncbi:MAG: hypothetical protein KTR31_08965 [Myxococcales bacterium]|nr:hypothetical protein [Myxococcales bacterium]
MVLTLEYDETGCRGTFEYQDWSSPLEWLVGLTGLGLLGTFGMVVWAGSGWTCMALFIGVLLVLRSGGGTAVVDQLAEAGGARCVARFHASGGWLTVVRGEHTDRLFLPQCRLRLHGSRLDVCSRLTGDRVVIDVGADQAAVQELAAVLEQMQRLELGKSTDVPPELQQLTRTAETPEV